MATIKSFTSLEQSKKLAEILPLESADMYYFRQIDNGYFPPDVEFIYPIPLFKDGKEDFNYDIRCWSLAALLSVLPTKLQIALAINDFQGDRKEKYFIGSVEHDKYDCFADNPVDACYEMILKLNELNLL